MNPSNPQDRQNPAPHIPERQALANPQIPARGNTTAINAAAANIARNQLTSIYNGNTDTPTPQTTPVEQEPSTQAIIPQQTNQQSEVLTQQSIEAENPYTRTHATHEQIQVEQWKQYHSAWQEYYQKYYERYYIGQVYQARQALEARVREAASQAPVAKQQEEAPNPPQTLSRNEAMYELRSSLLGRMRESAKKVRKSRHFVPLTSAIGVILLFLFLQFNQIIMANVQAYISPGDVDPANIIVNPSTDVAVSPDPKLIIPKINVDVPILWNTTPDYNSQMAAMQKGVAWFGIPGADSRPGQVGNTVLSGHSSNDITDPGDYKFIFARLDHLNNGDSIFINYQGKRYTYTVTKKQVVAPTDVSALVYPTTKPMLTLITCTPLGTSLNRLLVTAEQVSPDPSNASAAPTNSGTSTAKIMPGNAPTLFERLFGNNGN